MDGRRKNDRDVVASGGDPVEDGLGANARARLEGVGTRRELADREAAVDVGHRAGLMEPRPNRVATPGLIISAATRASGTGAPPSSTTLPAIDRRAACPLRPGDRAP